MLHVLVEGNPGQMPCGSRALPEKPSAPTEYQKLHDIIIITYELCQTPGPHGHGQTEDGEIYLDPKEDRATGPFKCYVTLFFLEIGPPAHSLVTITRPTFNHTPS